MEFELKISIFFCESFNFVINAMGNVLGSYFLEEHTLQKAYSARGEGATCQKFHEPFGNIH